MITPWNLYWLTRLDGLKNFTLGATAFIVLLFILSAVTIVAYCSCTDKWPRKSIVWIVFFVILAFVSGITGKAVETLVPTTKEMATIIVLPKIANSETVQEIGDDIKTLAKEWVLQLKPKGGAE